MKNKRLRNTLAGLSVLSLISFLSGYFLFNSVFSGYYFFFFPYLILFFFTVNAVFFVYFFRLLVKSHIQFIRSFMLITGIKLLIYFILIVIYVLVSPKTAISFAITLSALYILYTAYDLYVMLSLLKSRKEINDLPDQISN